MKTNIFIRLKEKQIFNAKFIEKQIGNFRDKRVLYLGPGDGYYIDYLKMNYKCDLTCIDKNKIFSDDLNKKGIKCHNQDILKIIPNYNKYFNIVFSFSFVQYIKPKNLKQFNDLCRSYLKNENSFALHLSIPNLTKFNKNINYSYKHNLINLRGYLIQLYYFYFKGNRFESKIKSYWHNPAMIKKFGGTEIRTSDTSYRFQYKLLK